MTDRQTSMPIPESAPARRGDRFPLAAGLFMAVFLTVALALAIANPALLVSPDEPLLDGSWAAAYQQRFDDESLLFEPAATTWGVIEYVLFAQGRPGLLVGDDDWLYSSEEFEYPASRSEATRALDANLTEIAAIEERLAQQGIDLVVALLPAKARVYPEHLGRYQLPEGPEQRYERALEGLEARGVKVADLLPALLQAKEIGSVFLRTDTHWTPFGARAAAQVVAAEVSSLGDFAWVGEEDYVTSRTEPEPYRGDLTRFLPLGPLYDDLGPPDDTLSLAQTRTSGSANGDLFAEVELPVVLVGTSYSQDERWNFAGWLRQALGSDVLSAAERGQGPLAPMLEYLAGEAFINSPPQVVVWEVPERYLSERWRDGEDEN